MPEPTGSRQAFNLIFVILQIAALKDRSPVRRMKGLYWKTSASGEVNAAAFRCVFVGKLVISALRIHLPPITACMSPNESISAPTSAALPPFTSNVESIGAQPARFGDSEEIGLKNAQKNESIRIHLNFKNRELGFENLHQDLGSLQNGSDRARLIKRLLLELAMSQSLKTNALPLLPTTKSIKVIFRLSSRDVGLEKLFFNLSKLSTTVERNQYVKRCLFNGLANPKNSALLNDHVAEPRREVATVLPSQAASSTEISVINPWASADLVSVAPALTAEESAANREKQKKANLAKFAARK